MVEGLLVGNTEELTHKLRPIAEILLNELGASYTQKCGRSLVGDSLHHKLEGRVLT